MRQFPTHHNPLLATDVYKLGHQLQFCPGTDYVYSYLQARSDKTFDSTVFFGLQYYLKNYLMTPLTEAMGEEFIEYHTKILGGCPQQTKDRIRALCKLGYWPLKIKAVPEGSTVPVRNVLMTIESTNPEFYWCVGFVESLLLKVWYPTTVATCSRKYRKLVDYMFDATCDDTPDMDGLRDFMVHDFGYRGDPTEEGAAISGSAHLLSFKGSDTIPALPFTERFYGPATMLSVPASEHSVMCSFGKDDELAAFRHMLKTYPTGIVSIVSDTYDVYRVLTEFAQALKPEILARDGKVVFRPDSGDPETIICGDPLDGGPYDVTPKFLGAIRLLDKMFGSTVNSKGYKVLNPKVGLIYGDGMYYERYERTLQRLKDMGYAACNLVIGVGVILRNHSRDTLGFANKATYVKVNGQPRDIVKSPVTDPKKKSHKGLLSLQYYQGQFETVDECSELAESQTLLRTVFEDGKLLIDQTFEEARSSRVNREWIKTHKEKIHLSMSSAA